MQKRSKYLSTGKLDLIGIGTSLLCMVHCALLPLLVSSLPLAGVNLIENKGVEYAMIGFAFLIGLFSFYSGCFKKHKNKRPLVIFIIGFAFLLFNQMEENLILILTASVLITIAHLWNFKLSNRHTRCQLRAISPST